MGLSALHDLHFLHPLWLFALLPLWVVAGFGIWRAHREGAWSNVIDADLLAALRLSHSQRGGSPWWLIGSAWTLAVLALASPTWQRVTVPAYRAPHAWVVVLDLSPSMAATDMQPDRVTRARYAIDDLLTAAHDSRVGLIVFAGEAHIVAPLTSDVSTVRSLLQPLTPTLMPEGGDNLAPALDDAAKLLQAGALRDAQVIVLSDGFADPSAAFAAAGRLRKLGASVQVVGVGTAQGAPLPDLQYGNDGGTNNGFVRNASGATVMTHLQVDRLQRVAATGGGRYVSLASMPQLLTQLQNDSTLQAAEQHLRTDAKVSNWLNGGIWLLPPLLLLAALLARRGWL